MDRLFFRVAFSKKYALARRIRWTWRYVYMLPSVWLIAAFSVFLTSVNYAYVLAFLVPMVLLVVWLEFTFDVYRYVKSGKFIDDVKRATQAHPKYRELLQLCDDEQPERKNG